MIDIYIKDTIDLDKIVLSTINTYSDPSLVQSSGPPDDGNCDIRVKCCLELVLVRGGTSGISEGESIGMGRRSEEHGRGDDTPPAIIICQDVEFPQTGVEFFCRAQNLTWALILDRRRRPYKIYLYLHFSGSLLIDTTYVTW